MCQSSTKIDNVNYTQRQCGVEIKMNVKKLSISGVAFVITVLGGYLVWDRIPEVDPDPANSPIEQVTMIEATQVPLTTAVANPAGIVFLPDTNTYLVSTDDRIIAEISADFSQVISSRTIPNSPHSIGDTEGITYLGDGKAAVIGENGVVILITRDGKGWKETDRFPIPGFKNETQLGSATYDPMTATIYTAQKKKGKILYKINLKRRTAMTIPMSLGPTVKERLDRKWQELTVAGLQFYKERLYAISEAYSSLLVFNPDGILEEVIGLKGINESSGITVRDGVLILIGDAEGYLPDPPIYLIPKSITDR